MDPDVNLERLLELAREIVTLVDTSDGDDWGETDRGDLEDIAARGGELAEYVLALHEWLAKGGALPKDWSKVAWSNGVTLAQAITLGGKVRAEDTMHVTMGGAGLGSDYLYVSYTNDPFVLGIDREGRGSS